MVGITIMTGFRYNGHGAWTSEKVYSPDNGKTYSGIIKLESPDRMQLRGYVGIPLFGRSEVWCRKEDSSAEF